MPPSPRRLLLPLLLCLATAATPAAAWGELGHRLVAALAEQQLAPATRARALALLADDGASDLAAVASWADRVREQPEYAWSVRFHFVNLPDDCSWDARRDCADDRCIVAALQRFIRTLGDAGQAAAARAEALKFVVHLVADIHQPLHAGHAHDLGGNKHQLSLGGHGSNLHAVWDRELLASAELGAEAYLARLAQRAPTPAGTLTAADWAIESCRLIGTESIYPAQRKIDGRYLDRHRPLAEARLRLAAARLAAVLEQALGEG